MGIGSENVICETENGVFRPTKAIFRINLPKIGSENAVIGTDFSKIGSENGVFRMANRIFRSANGVFESKFIICNG